MRPWNGAWTKYNLQQSLPLPCFDAGTIFRFFVCIVFDDTGIQVGFLNAIWHSCLKREPSCTDRTWFAVLCGLFRFWECQLEQRIQSHRHVSRKPFLNLLPNLQNYFLKFPDHHCELKFEFVVTKLWSMDLEPSATLASHAADFNKKISNSFGFKYHPLNSSTLWTCSSSKLKFEKPYTCVASRELTLNPIFTTSYPPDEKLIIDLICEKAYMGFLSVDNQSLIVYRNSSPTNSNTRSLRLAHSRVKM